jgi:NAD+ kinase
MHEIRTLGVVLHPRRDSTEAVNTVLRWADDRDVKVLGLAEEVGRLDCRAVVVPAAAMAAQADLLVAMGGDGTVLRAMRLADGCRAPVLGVNLGKLGFLAEVDIPDLAAALTAIGAGTYEIEVRTALDATIGAQQLTAFNDVVIVRVPGDGTAAIDLSRGTTSSATPGTLSLFQPQRAQRPTTFLPVARSSPLPCRGSWSPLPRRTRCSTAP